MFGIGGFEFFIILIIALLVVGPNELPKILYYFGKISKKIRRYTKEIQEGIDQITEQVELEEIIKDANKAGDELTEFRIEQQKAIEARDKKAIKKKSKSKKISAKSSNIKTQYRAKKK